jgi:hypothetical protein
VCRGFNRLSAGRRYELPPERVKSGPVAVQFYIVLSA